MANDNGPLGYEICLKLMVMSHYQRANATISSWYNNGTSLTRSISALKILNNVRFKKRLSYYIWSKIELKGPILVEKVDFIQS